MEPSKQQNETTEGGPTEGSAPSHGAARLRFYRSDRLDPQFTPLKPFDGVELELSEVKGDLIDRLKVRFDAVIKAGTYALEVADGESLLVEAASACQVHGYVSADQTVDPMTGRSMITGAEITFEPELALTNVWGVLTKLPGIFLDNDLAALKKQVNRILESETAAEVERLGKHLLQRLGDGFDAVAPPLAALGPEMAALGKSISNQASRFFRSVSDGVRQLRNEIRGTPDRLPIIHLRQIVARPVERRGRWELDLRFSGDGGYPGKVMQSFNHIALPRTILPAPHALLLFLLSSQPLATAELDLTRIKHREAARLFLEALARFEVDFEIVGRLPSLVNSFKLPNQDQVTQMLDIPQPCTMSGVMKGAVEPDEVKVELLDFVLDDGTGRISIEGGLNVRRQDGIPEEQESGGGGTVAMECVDAAYDLVWPFERLSARGSLDIGRGSGLSRVLSSIEIENPLARGKGLVSASLSGIELGGSMTFRTGRQTKSIFFENTRLSLAASVALGKETELYDGVTSWTPSLDQGHMSVDLRSTGEGGAEADVCFKAGLSLTAHTRIEAFPELNIADGTLRTKARGELDFKGKARTTPPQGNLLTAFFEDTEASFTLAEGRLTLDRRRLELPKGSYLGFKVTQAELSTTGLGKGSFELEWDFHGLSPVLGDGKRSLEILVPELRQGRFVVAVCPVGGLTITGARHGLYDAHFFNALINPGAEPRRWLAILDSEEAMEKVLSAVELFWPEAAGWIETLRAFARKARRVFDEEGIKEPKDLIPGSMIAKVLSKLICGTDVLKERIYPLVKQVTDGDGLDVPAVKRLLSDHLPEHDFEFELDRGLRWLSLVLTPTAPLPPMTVEKQKPLVEQPEYRKLLEELPTPDALYRVLEGTGPFEPAFSADIASAAPYLTLEQLELILEKGSDRLDPDDLARISTVSAIKKRIQMISESYGGMAFLPQAWAISFFLWEAVRIRPLSQDRSAHRTKAPSGYRLADGLLGPEEVAALLQSSVASFFRGPTVLINQHMLMDYMRRQPPTFVREVLFEMAHGTSRALASVLYALVNADQRGLVDPVDVAALLERALGIEIPKLSDYLAGGRWAKESHYEALARTAEQIIADAEPYRALKEHLTVHRRATGAVTASSETRKDLLRKAVLAIEQADGLAKNLSFKEDPPEALEQARKAYEKAFGHCAEINKADPTAFKEDAFKAFWARNYEALMILSVVRNHQEAIDEVPSWLATRLKRAPAKDEQGLIEDVVEALYFFPEDRRKLLADPLVRLLVDPAPGRYDFTVISCMGVITEGARGTELTDAYRRLTEKRGIRVIRADTQTARSLAFNAARVEEAVRMVEGDWGYIGYSQGCANGLMAESRLLGGTPRQQSLARGLRCRNLLFSAVNGSAHGTCGDMKLIQAMTYGDKFLKHYQAIFSRRATNLVLSNIRLLLDSKPFIHSLGGVESLSYEGVRALARNGQFKSDVPTSYIRGIVEPETLPEALEWLSNVLTKQIESTAHDTQVTMTEAVGHPVWMEGPQADVLRSCDMGALVQRTHHWSPLKYATEFVTTRRDLENAIYHFPKDRHVFPWIEVNARFGIIARVGSR